jgi:hypothetical protein
MRTRMSFYANLLVKLGIVQESDLCHICLDLDKSRLIIPQKSPSIQYCWGVTVVSVWKQL